MLEEFNKKGVVDKITGFIEERYEESNSNKLIIGISGGIDSSVTASLSKMAVGEENVLGVSLPITKESDLPKKFADSINIDFEEIGLSSSFNEIFNKLKGNCRHFDGERISLANIKARLRMIFLYYHSNVLDGLVVGTGNKSELSIGYFTKYGDGGVDFFPIGDLYKSQVYVLAEYLDLPEEIIEKEPSAGLWEGQTDENEIGYSYDVLDEVLYSLEQGMNEDEIQKQFGHNSDVIEDIKEMKRCSKHKRENPPICSVF